MDKDSIESNKGNVTDGGRKASSSENQSSDPQVKSTRSYKTRRSFPKKYKYKILDEYDACKDSAARGSLLRREGLYSSRISTWRKQRASESVGETKKQTFKPDRPRTEHLARENEQLKKKLAQAEAIIELQKKVSDLLGTHILPQELSEVKS